METTFWIGLGLGAILSLLTSALITVYNDRIQDAIEGRKRIRLNKRREAELGTYRLICDLKQGKPEAYVSFISQQTNVTYYLLFTICFVIFLLSFLAVAKLFPPEKISERLVLVIGIWSFLLGSAATTLQACWHKRRQATLERKLARFEEYRNELIKTWNDIRLD